ncbi:hypothetical protein D3C81_1323130 [compost metagenome]
MAQVQVAQAMVLQIDMAGGHDLDLGVITAGIGVSPSILVGRWLGVFFVCSARVAGVVALHARPSYTRFFLSEIM